MIPLLFKHPGYENAKDICRYRHLKAGLVSFHVDKLVSENYLIREPVADLIAVTFTSILFTIQFNKALKKESKDAGN